MQKKSRSVVITGASAGLGRALALESARRGDRVSLVSRSKDKLSEISHHIKAEGGQAAIFPADIMKESQILEMMSQILRTYGDIDLLLNCAGVLEPVAPLVKNSGEALKTSLLTNVFGAYIITREALRRMLSQENGGTIVHITSSAADNPYAGWTAYGSQKAAVNMLTRIVALETRDRPVRIFGISPGPFESHMQQLLRDSHAADFPQQDKFIRLYEKNELGSAEKIAHITLDITGTEWPELSGRIVDLRSQEFQKDCAHHGLHFSTTDFQGFR
jgi:3-oxoacyl-[acyl-carrier protein] reductase